MAYGRWSRHVNDYHNENNSQDQVVDGNVEAEKRPQPKKRAEPKKKVEPKRATKKVAKKNRRRRRTIQEETCYLLRFVAAATHLKAKSGQRNENSRCEALKAILQEVARRESDSSQLVARKLVGWDCNMKLN